MGWTVRPRRRHGGWSFTLDGQTVWRKRESDAWAELARRQGESAEPDGQPVTIAGLIDRWDQQHDSAHGRDRLADLEEWAGRTLLADVPPDFLVRYHTWLSRTRRTRRAGRQGGRRLSPETVRKNIRYATTVLRWGAEQGWVRQTCRQPKLTRPPTRVRSLSRGQLDSLWASMRTDSVRYRYVVPLVRFLLETGCRPTEGRLLRWSQVDLRRRVVTIPEHKAGQRTGEPRVFGLSATAAQIVRQQRGRHRVYVFTSRLGRPYTRDGLASIVRRHGVAVYQLRHTWCQRATEAGLPDHTILRQMGHSSSRMLATYRRITDAQLVAASGQLDGLSRADTHTPQPQPDGADCDEPHGP